MSEAAASYAIRVTIEKISRGNRGGPNSAKQVVGTGANGATITSATGSISIEQPVNNCLEVNDAQVTGLLGYIGLLDGRIDTSAIETAVATLVAAS